MTAVLQIESIRLDFQSHESLIEETVIEYRERTRAGEQLEPIRVYFDGAHYWLADGFHRIEAARLEGVGNINAEIIPGTYADLQAEWKRLVDALRADLRRGQESS
jgi:hypothetical protein